MPDFSNTGLSTVDQLAAGTQNPGTPEDGVSLSDFGHAAMSGIYGLQAAIHSGSAAIQSNPEDEQYYDSLAQASREKSGDSIAAMSPSDRARIDASITSGEFWHSPISSGLLKGTQMAPAMAVQTLGGLMGGVPGAVATGAALNAMQLRDTVMDNLHKAPVEQLRDNNPLFASLLQTMSPDDAKEMLGDKILNGDGYLMIAGIAGALGGGFGLSGLIARGGVAGKALTRAGLGALEGGSAAAFQGGVTDAAQQSALMAAGTQDSFDKDEWASNVLEQLVPGVVLGGAHSLVHGAHVDDPTKTPQLGNTGMGQAAAAIPNASASTQAKPGQADGGRATGTRSTRAYPKTDTSTTTEPTVSAPSPPNPSDAALPTADPAVTAALTPKPVPKPVKRPTPPAEAPPTPEPVAPPVTPEGNSPPPAAPTPPTDSGILQAGPHPLADQHAALAAGTRSAVLYPDENVLPLPDGMKQTKIKQGIVQWNPEQISRQKISQALRDGTFDRVSAPTPTPEPVATTAPDATVGTQSHPSPTVEGSQQSGILASTPHISNSSTDELIAPHPPINNATAKLLSPNEAKGGPPRVLADVSDEAKAHAQAAADKINANINPPAPKEGPKGENRSRAKAAARLSDNDTADQIMAAHPPADKEAFAMDPTAKGGMGSRTAVLERAKAMLGEAKDKGVKIVAANRDNADPTMNPSLGMELLMEARKLTKFKVATTAQFETFVKREYDLRLGESVKNERRAEGDAAKSRNTISSEAEEAGTYGATESHEDETLDRLDAEKARAGVEPEAVTLPAPTERLPPPMRGNFSAFKEAKKPSVVIASKGREAVKARIAAARAATETTPTEAQKIAGNYPKGKLTFEGNPITIENPKGSIREGVDANGKPWETKLPGDYGYIRGTKGADGDHVDTLIGDKGETGKAFVVNQKDPKTGEFDEHKVIQGVNTEAEAKALYNKSFSDGSGPDRMASVTELSHDQLIEWLHSPAGTMFALDEVPNQIVTSRGNFQPVETTNVHDLMTKMNPRGTGVTGSKLVPFMANRLKELAGDVPVHWVDQDTITRLWGKPGIPEGMYMTRDKMILMNAEIPVSDYTHVFMHEAVHAALAHALEKNPEFKPQIRMLMDLFAEKNPGKNTYAQTNEHEFLAEILSRSDMQDLANKTALPPQLANALGIPQFRAASLWSGLVALARQILRMPPKAATIMEGAMAVAEKLSWDKQPVKALQFGARLGKAHDEGRIHEFASLRDTTRGLTDPTEEGRERLSAVTLAGNLVSKALGSLPASESMHEMGVKLQTSDQLRQGNEKYFGPLNETNPMRIVVDTSEKMGVRMQHYLEGANKLAKDLAIARKQFEGPVWDKMAGLISDMSTYNLHADSPLDSDANRHLRLPKDAKTEAQGATRVWQSRAKHPELEATYNSLPNELQRLVGRLGDYYESEHVERSKAVLTGILDAHEPTPGSTVDEVIDRAINGKMTDEDVEHYDKLGIGKALKGATEFQKPQGFYAPKKRFGEYVASGEHEVTIPSNATKIDDNTMEFNSREEAHDYVAKADLPASVEIRHYDPTTGARVRADEAISSGAPPVTKYRVSVENSHLEFADTIKQAKNARQAMIDAGIKTKDVDRRSLNKEVDYSLSSPQMQALIKGVERRQDLSRAQKDVLIRSMTESSITMRAGNRLDPHFLKARNVAGESQDVVRTLTNYSCASAAYRSRGDFAPIIDNAMKDMATTLESNRYDGNTFQRRVAHQELEQRIYGFGSPEYSGRMAPFWSKVMALSFWKRMMSPAHLLLHITHPGMISGPILGSRHGFGQAYRELYRSYRDMGGVVPALGQGAKGLVNVFKEDSEPTNFLDYFKRKLATAKDGSAVLKMIGELEETGHIHPNQGMEVGHFAETATATQRAMERVDRAFRELTSSTESINRVAESVAAYRLELRKNGGDHEGAVRYAKDTLANTQGLYSATNAAPLFRNKTLRPFLQFKQFPQMIYHLLAKNLYTIVKGEDKAVRIQAAKAFAGVVATHAAMAGVMGLPLEVIKASVLFAHAIGLTNTGWDDVEDNIQEEMARLFGPQLGEIVSNGLTRALGPLSFAGQHRLGLGSLSMWSEPASGKSSDTLHWFLDTLAGAPGSMVEDYLDASQAALKGDWEGAFEKANPIKALADLSKAARLGVYGKPTASGKPGMAPLGPAQTFMQGIGFKPGDAAQYDTARWASEKEEKRLSQEKATLIGNWTKATGAARAKAMQAISAYNSSVPVDQRISDKHMQASLKAQQGTYELGQRVTPRNKALLDNYNELYNVR